MLLGGGPANRRYSFRRTSHCICDGDAAIAGRQDLFSAASRAAPVDCCASDECERFAGPTRSPLRRLGTRGRGSVHRRPASARFRSGRRRGDTQFHAPHGCGRSGASCRVVARHETAGSAFASQPAEGPVGERLAADLDVTGRCKPASGDSRQPSSPPPHAHRMPPHDRTGCDKKKAALHPLGKGERGCKSTCDSKNRPLTASGYREAA